MLFGTVKVVGADTIVPLVVENVTVVPCGMMLALMSVIVTKTVVIPGVNGVPLLQTGELTSTEAIGTLAASVNWNTGSDPEKMIGKLRRT